MLNVNKKIWSSDSNTGGLISKEQALIVDTAFAQGAEAQYFKLAVGKPVLLDHHNGL